MGPEISENHKKYLERKALFKNFGYDVDRERDFIIEEALPIGGAILEAGTGKGHFALALAKRGYRFVTFDIAQEVQAIARLNLKQFGLDHLADFRIEDGECLSFEDERFDIVFSINVLHHLLHPYRVMDELIRVLSRQGKIVMSDFTPAGFAIMDKIHASEGGRHESGKTSSSAINEYLIKKGFKTRIAQTLYQSVCVAHRDTP